MAYPYTNYLLFPLKGVYKTSYKFNEKCSFNNVYWGIHLGEDYNTKSGESVISIGRGRVVYAALHAGNKKKPNWGNIIIIAHKCSRNRKVFYSLYGHLGKIFVKKGNIVNIGDKIGLVGSPRSRENGWWNEAHLHFAIYTGPWNGKVLPGYYRYDQKRTKKKYWKNPSKYIKWYNSQTCTCSFQGS